MLISRWLISLLLPCCHPWTTKRNLFIIRCVSYCTLHNAEKLISRHQMFLNESMAASFTNSTNYWYHSDSRTPSSLRRSFRYVHVHSRPSRKSWFHPSFVFRQAFIHIPISSRHKLSLLTIAEMTLPCFCYFSEMTIILRIYNYLTSTKQVHLTNCNQVFLPINFISVSQNACPNNMIWNINSASSIWRALFLIVALRFSVSHYPSQWSIFIFLW